MKEGESQHKNIYFVRHGESEGNAQNVRQGKDTLLSDEGRAQADSVAERFTRIPIDIILASPYPRAMHTAEAIKEKIQVPIEETPLAEERKHASEFLGKLSKDADVQEKLSQIYERWRSGDTRYRYADEENFDELVQRARSLAQLIAQRPEKNILVVSHGFFMRIFLSYVMFGENVTAEEFFKICESHYLKNTGITMYEYIPEDNHWWLVAWNDHAHLG